MIANKDIDRDQVKGQPDRPCRQPLSHSLAGVEYWDDCKNPTALRCPACGDAICSQHYLVHSRVCIGGPL